jgi:predicted O-methyltransferase YrrM
MGVGDKGYSTFAFLAALLDTGGGLTSVDIGPCEDVRAAVAEYAPGAAHTFVQGDSLAVAEKLPAPIDVLMLDTSHTYSQTVSELETYAGSVSHAIVLHDIRTRSTVWQALYDWWWDHWLEWVGEIRFNCNGLAVLWRADPRQHTEGPTWA